MHITFYSISKNCRATSIINRIFNQDKRIASVLIGNNVLARGKTTAKVPYPPIHIVGQSAAQQKDKGRIYDKLPFKFECIKGKSYLWCACGFSKTQPFCDSTHKNSLMKITMRPIRFIAPETKEYWFCNCKQTENRPFCDGSHRRVEVQDAIR